MLAPRRLYIDECSHAREARSEDVELAENFGGVFAALGVTQMVLTEFLSTKGGVLDTGCKFPGVVFGPSSGTPGCSSRVGIISLDPWLR